MTDFFTLNPRYERYELGVYPLEPRTVQNINIHPAGNIRYVVVGIAVLILILIISDSSNNSGEYIAYRTASGFIEILVKLVFISTVILGPIGLIISRCTNKRYKQLTTKGVLLNGTISAIYNEDVRYWTRSGWVRAPNYIFVTYSFTSPNGNTLSGEQMRIRDDLRDKLLPPVGTPIRVLYADEDTYVML